MLAKLRRFCRIEHISTARGVWVFDRGIVSEENLRLYAGTEVSTWWEHRERSSRSLNSSNGGRAGRVREDCGLEIKESIKHEMLKKNGRADGGTKAFNLFRFTRV